MDITCESSNNSPSWSALDLVWWQLLKKTGFESDSISYIQNFKDNWVKHNRVQIVADARSFRFPPELLAGVCWIEVGGDPEFIDGLALEIRAFDWSGPDFIDQHFTITKNPIRTSFGAVSMQLGTAAETLGFNHQSLDMEDYRKIAQCLSVDKFNIRIVAKHIRDLIDHDGLQKKNAKGQPDQLSDEAIRVAGARYNRGKGLSLESIRKNTSYGDFILKHWTRFTRLLF